MLTLLEQFKAARRVSTPLLAILTQDPAETIRAIAVQEKEMADAEPTEPAPLFAWEGVKGMSPINKTGVAAFSAMSPDGSPILNLVEACQAFGEKATMGSVLFIHQAHRQMEIKALPQALWNLRDLCKQDSRAVVLLAPSLSLPADLASDVVVLDEPLPSDDQLRAIVLEAFRSAGMEKPKDSIATQAVDSVRGLAAFPAEQIIAMSLTEDGLDMEALWERKRKMIEQTPGLSVEREGVSFSKIGGLQNAKTFGERLFKSDRAPRLIVRLDELEKYMGGSTGGDNTGAAQDQLGVILREMEDNDWAGLIAAGPAGSGKSLFSKALGNMGGVLTMNMDLGGMKAKHLGDSEARIRNAMKVVKSVAGRGGAFFVATCNRLSALPPELRRRFRFGIWYFDLPTKQEREVIWVISLEQFGLPTGPDKSPRPDDTDWTGADIRNCCDLASRMGCSLKEAAEYIVPVAKSDPDSITQLRTMANGRFLSASQVGTYTMNAGSLTEPAPPTRRIKQ